MAAQPTKQTNTETKAELVKTEPVAPLASARHAASSLLEVIERAARDPNVDIEKMERLFMLKERADAAERKAAFDEAMANAQAKLKLVIKSAEIRHGNQLISKYATLDDIDAGTRDAITSEGFSLRYNSTLSDDGKRMKFTLTVAHRLGHENVTNIELGVEKSGAMNATQAVGSATTYARRALVQMAFNIVTTGMDDDGRAASPVRPLMSAKHIGELKKAMSDARDAGFGGFEDTDLLKSKRVNKYEELVDDEFAALLDSIKRRRENMERRAPR